MTRTAWGDRRTVGDLLRQWRTRRRLSQLDLAIQADISTRHLSFVETADELLTPPVNVLRLSLHPGGMAPRIANLGEWRAHLLGRLRRQATLTADPTLTELYAELRGYPCEQPQPEIELPGPGDVLVALHYRHDDQELSFFSTTAVFGTPLDITLAELAIEAFYPANSTTAAAAFRAATSTGSQTGENGGA